MRSLVVVASLLSVLAPTSSAGASPRLGAAEPSTSGHIVWTQRGPDGRESLRIAKADGTGERALTHAGQGEKHIGAQLSPTGRWIAYEVDKQGASQVRLVRPDGTDDHKLPLGCHGMCLGVKGPTWAGKRVLFVTRVFGPVRHGHPAESLLWAVRIDGRSKVRTSLATAAGRYEDSYAHVSRGGYFVTWTRTRVSDGKSTIMRVDVDGDDEAALLPWGLGVEAHDLSPAKSGPTRDLVIFESNGRGNPRASFVDVGAVSIQCNSPKKCARNIVWLTDNKASGRRSANPQWSPDGLDYVFNVRRTVRSQRSEIVTARYGTAERRRITASKRFDYRPDWGR